VWAASVARGFTSRSVARARHARPSNHYGHLPPRRSPSRPDQHSGRPTAWHPATFDEGKHRAEGHATEATGTTDYVTVTLSATTKRAAALVVVALDGFGLPPRAELSVKRGVRPRSSSRSPLRPIQRGVPFKQLDSDGVARE
jgi:hypothetical protein